MKTCITDKNKGRLRQGAALLFWLGLWQLLAAAIDNSLLLPSVIETLSSASRLAGTGEFYLNIGWTFLRCVLAMSLSFVIGTAAGWLSHASSIFKSFMTLPVGFFKSVPVMAIVIYVILLVHSDWVAVIVCFLMCFPVVYTNVLSGLDSMEQGLLEVAEVYGLTAAQKIRHIYFPGIMAQIKAAIRLTAGLSWKAVVAAEVLSVPAHSLGYEMIIAKNYMETSDLFAYISVIVLLSLVMEKSIDFCLSRWTYKSYEGSKLIKDKDTILRQKKNQEHEAQSFDVYLHGVSKTFDGKDVLSEVNFRFEGGKATAVTGPSGQGKTTLARIISGLEEPDKGYVEKKGKLSYLFQEDRLIPWLNVLDNIALSSIGRGGATYEEIERIAECLELSEALWMLPGKLSGGMRHRTALGRTFASDADIIILDEPFRGLDKDLKSRIIQNLWREKTEDKTVIMITHSRTDAVMLSDRTVKFEDFAK